MTTPMAYLTRLKGIFIEPPYSEYTGSGVFRHTNCITLVSSEKEDGASVVIGVEAYMSGCGTFAPTQDDDVVARFGFGEEYGSTDFEPTSGEETFGSWKPEQPADVIGES